MPFVSGPILDVLQHLLDPSNVQSHHCVRLHSLNNRETRASDHGSICELARQSHKVSLAALVRIQQEELETLR